jgi:Ion channel
MAFVQATVLSFVLLGVCVMVHYEVFRWVSGHAGTWGLKDRRLILRVVTIALAAHVVEMVVFAAGYYLADEVLKVGEFVGADNPGALDYLYFSMETYTSLGVGDVHPIGATRVMVGVETLGGLILIGWSTSFTYLSMRRFWDAASE